MCIQKHGMHWFLCNSRAGVRWALLGTGLGGKCTCRLSELCVACSLPSLTPATSVLSPCRGFVSPHNRCHLTPEVPDSCGDEQQFFSTPIPKFWKEHMAVHLSSELSNLRMVLWFTPDPGIHAYDLWVTAPWLHKIDADNPRVLQKTCNENWK